MVMLRNVRRKRRKRSESIGKVASNLDDVDGPFVSPSPKYGSKALK